MILITLQSNTKTQISAMMGLWIIMPMLQWQATVLEAIMAINQQRKIIIRRVRTILLINPIPNHHKYAPSLITQSVFTLVRKLLRGERWGVKNNCLSVRHNFVRHNFVRDTYLHVQLSHPPMTLHFQNLRNHDGHSSLLLLCRCLWYRHGRWRTSSSMTLLCYHDRRFTTTFVVGSQDTSKIVHPQMTSKYSSPPMCVVSPINDCYWRCHHSIPTYIV